MKNRHISLHTDHKKILSLVVSFTLLFVLLSVFAVLTTHTYLTELNTLRKSDYEYSAITQEGTGQDNYILFDAGISFTISEKADRRLNADIIMQSSYAEYSNKVFWNTVQLEPHEIAVSMLLARQYGIGIGSTLYSKHVVDGSIHEYTITALLPPVNAARIAESTASYEGLIIMGYDSLYEKNIAHSFLVFTNASIDELSKQPITMPHGIVYRSSEISAMTAKVVPYIILSVMLAAAATVAFAVILKKEIYCNSRRMILLGFPREQITRSFYLHICGPVTVAVMIAAAVSFVISLIINLELPEVVGAFLQTITELIALLITAFYLNKHLWRT